MTQMSEGSERSDIQQAKSHLQQTLEKGKFAVTAEIWPAKGANAQRVRNKAAILKGWVDAVNPTDNPTAIIRMSGLVTSLILLEEGVEPVLQLQARDRNRLALQSDVLGASAMGIRNILCLTGDHQSFGKDPQAKGVFDIDSTQMLQAFKRMRDEGLFISGERVKPRPELFLGGAANPFGDPFEARVPRLAKKINAGAQFVQTQPVFDLERFYKWMAQVRSRGFHEKVHIIAGISPLKKARVARIMQEKVPGMLVPPEVVERMESASDPEEEGVKLAVELIQQVKAIEGVSGVHIMAAAWEKIVPVVVREAGLR